MILAHGSIIASCIIDFVLLNLGRYDGHFQKFRTDREGLRDNVDGVRTVPGSQI